MKFTMYSGAFLAIFVAVMSLDIVSGAIFHEEEAEPGFAIIAEESASAEQAPAEEEGLAPITPLLASADIAKGESVFKKCAACHSDEAGAANKVGPNLWGVVGRAPGKHDGFGYSSALASYGEANSAWDFEALNRFLYKPKEYISGTSMGFAGLSKEQERADVIAYLNSTSDAPLDIPSQ